VSAAWDKSWEKCSGYDSSDYYTVAAYNLDYVCAVQFGDRPDKITFYLYFRQFVTRYQFNNSYGSWAAATIDTNFDGEWDVYVRTEVATLPTDSQMISGRAVNARYQTLGCPVSVWSNVGASAKWIALEVSKSCLRLPADGFAIQGYADSEYYTDDGYDWAPSSAVFIAPPQNSAATTTTTTSTTTTSTTTTVAPLQIPNGPSSLSVSRLSDSTLRVTWLDNSSNEEGFLIQRDDLPVASGTTTAAWPYRSPAGATTWDATGLVVGKRYCFTVASFNAAGASRFADWACLDLVSSTVGSSASTASTGSSALTCDGSRGVIRGSQVTLRIQTNQGNAGRRLSFEAFVDGQWTRIGTARTLADGVANLKARVAAVGKTGPVPIRATQGSRFICEGTLS
jgi:hypothetical protein